MAQFINYLEKLSTGIVAVLIILFAGFSYFMIDPTEVESREQSLIVMKEELTATEKKVREAQDFERQFEDKKKRYADLVKELQNIQGALPKEFILPELFSELLREAKQLEVEITSIAPDASEEQKELYNTLGFNIEARGTFLQFFIFLDRLANLKRLVNVQEFSINKDGSRPILTLGGEEGAFAGSKFSGGRSAFPGISAKLRVVTYRYRSAPAPTKEVK